jgi:hypothetical protein
MLNRFLRGEDSRNPDKKTANREEAGGIAAGLHGAPQGLTMKEVFVY